MSFNVDADAYGRFIGRYSVPLAAQFVLLADVVEGQQALDVGCGTGALTAELVERVGAGAVSAIDPSEPFVETIRSRFPGVDVRQATAERLPFADDAFDAAYAALVVHFMKDPVTGLTQMSRVTRAGGSVAACVWDHAGGSGPLAVFWKAVTDMDPTAHDESRLPGVREGHLAELFTEAGLREIESSVLTVRVGFAGFDDWWEPYTLGVGPAGDYVRQLDAAGKAELRARCAELLPQDAPFDIVASAWTAVGRV